MYFFLSGYSQSQFPHPGVRLQQQRSEMWYYLHRRLCSDTQLSNNEVLYEGFSEHDRSIDSSEKQCFLEGSVQSCEKPSPPCFHKN